MTPQQIDLVKATVPVLRENGVALTGYFYNRMLGNNPNLKETFNMGHQRSGAQAQALAGAVLAYAENIEDPSVLLPVVELIAHKHVSLNIQAPDYNIVGENLLHSISEVLSISMEDPLIDAWATAYGQLADLFISTEKAIYEQHQQTKGSWLGWRNFKIAKKVVESDEITSFYLAPVDGGDLPKYEAGQYISVRVFVEELGLKQPRQYTLSTSPQADYLRISVKREDEKGDLAGGWVSNTLHGLAEGAEIEVSAPTGNFYLIDPNKRNVFISGGHAMKQHIHDLKAKYPRLSTFTAYEFPHQSDVLGQDYDAKGRLDLSTIDSAILPVQADYYLCGPMPFMAEQQKALIARGVPAENIHSEAFGTGGVHH